MSRQIPAIALTLLMCWQCSARADLLVTYSRDFSIGGNVYLQNQMVYEDSGASQLYFDNALITGNQRITGFHSVRPNEFLFTTQGNFSIAGSSFNRGDVVRYNKHTNSASLVFDSANLSDTRIRALSQFDDGEIAFSLNQDFTIGTTNYRQGDIVRYNTITNAHRLYFNVDDITDNAATIEALHVLSDTEFIFSHSRAFTLDGTRFRRGDIVHYNTDTGVAYRYRNRNTLANETRMTALSIAAVPEPEQIGVLCVLVALAVIAIRRRKRSMAC